MRRLLLTLLLALAATALGSALPAFAAPKKAARTPVITKVAPMRVGVGGKLTISGRNFKTKRAANTVIFRAPGGRSAFAKPRRATSTRLVVLVPGAVRRLLSGSAGSPRPTRFKLRVLAGKFSRYTARRLSPVVTAGGAGGPGGPGGAPGGSIPSCDSGPDHDGDLLSNSFELQIKTDPCLRDTDLDGVEDGYEFQSALDLNRYPRVLPLPYPGRRPYPNALDSGDGNTDYDDDGLWLSEEYELWIRYAADGAPRAGRPQTLSGLLYSDGLQKSIDPAPSAAPAGSLARWALDIDNDGALWDDERDADADGLGNWDEQHGRFTEQWWPSTFDGNGLPKESKYPDLDFLDNEDLPGLDAAADPDMDGDGVRDGADDHDHDGLSNSFEVHRPGDYLTDAFGPPAPGPNVWAYVNPFNPCKPVRSERCHRSVPFGYYDSDQAPPVGNPPPAGFPGSGVPPTPDN
jgi:hypothetical protein